MKNLNYSAFIIYVFIIKIDDNINERMVLLFIRFKCDKIIIVFIGKVSSSSRFFVIE